MKKILLTLLFILLFIPLTVFAEEKVEIKSITLIDKSDNAIIVEDASTDGEKINLNLIFYDVGDYANYKLIVKNNNDVGLYINDKTFESTDSHMEYSFTYDNDSNFIESGEEKEVKLKVSYKTEIKVTDFLNAKYDASGISPLTLSDEIIDIPNTLRNLGIVSIILLVTIILINLIGVLLITKNVKKSSVNIAILIIMIILIPKYTNALFRVDIPIDSKIIVKYIKDNNCTFEGELTAGKEFIDGQFVYRYKQEATGNTRWNSISEDGWGVRIIDRDSTTPVTTKLCTSINGKPVVSMSWMFFSSKTSSIDLTSFETSNVKRMDNMFREMPNVSKLDVRMFDTSNVTSMGAMFYSNANLETIDGLKAFKTDKVTSIACMFGFNDKLKKLDLSTFELDNASGQYNMLMNSFALREIITPKSYNNDNVILPNIFKDENDVLYASLTRPKLINKKIVYYEDSAIFDYGYTVNSRFASLAGGSKDNIQRIERSYERPSDEIIQNTNNQVSDYYSNKKIYAWYDNGTIYYYTEADNVYFGIDSRSFFNSLSNLSYVNLNDIKSTFINEANSMFYYASRYATSIDYVGLDKFDSSRIENMEYMFSGFGYNVTNLSLDFSKWDFSNVTSIRCLFEGLGYNSTTVHFEMKNRIFNKATNTNYIFSSVGFNAPDVYIDVSGSKFPEVTDATFTFSTAAQKSEKVYLNIEDWELPKNKTLAYFFNYAISYADDVTIEGLEELDVSKVESLSGFFYSAIREARNLNLDLSSWDVSNVTNFTYMFKYFEQDIDDTVLTIKNWNINKDANLYNMFCYVGYNVKTLTLDLQGWNLSGKTSINGIFDNIAYNTTDKVTINLSNWNTTGLESIGGLVNYVRYTDQFKLILTGWDTSSVTTMDRFISSTCPNATKCEIVGLESLDLSNVTSMTYAFYGTSGITFNNFKIYADNISYAFSDSKNITGTISIMNNPTYYTNTFDNVVNDTNTLTVNYTNAVTDIDDIIATKGTNDKIVKGQIIT